MNDTEQRPQADIDGKSWIERKLMHLKKTELQTRVERRCWENVNTLEVVVEVNLWEFK